MPKKWLKLFYVMPKSKPHVYFVGIGGASLNGLAQVLLEQGYKVSGSDLTESAVTDKLRALGITVHIGQQAANITPDITEVTISSAVTKGPGAVEVAAARKLNIPVHKRTIWWSRLMSKAKVAVAVAGTHGKTTTTAMVGLIMQQAGLDPTVLVGGEVSEFGGTVRVGSHEYIVVEADEYDKAFYATRPTHAIITNIDYDHPDTYPNPVSYVQAFKRFARGLNKRQGILVILGDSKTTRSAFNNWHSPLRWYGKKNLWPGLKLQQPGDHLQLNATAAAKICHELGIEKKIINQALNSFTGVARRFELIGQFAGIPVYDDYAHHPTELAATIAAARKITKKIAVLFQPHQRVRTQQFKSEFARVLSTVPKVGLLPLFEVAGREEDIKVSSEDIIKELPKSSMINDEDIIQFMKECKNEGIELILALGAGDISSKVRKAISYGEK